MILKRKNVVMFPTNEKPTNEKPTNEKPTNEKPTNDNMFIYDELLFRNKKDYSTNNQNYNLYTLTDDDIDDGDVGDGNALDGLSISDWECKNNRGFWGNSSSGFIKDEDIN